MYEDIFNQLAQRGMIDSHEFRIKKLEDEVKTLKELIMMQVQFNIDNVKTLKAITDEPI